MMEDPRNKANDIAKKLGYYDYSYFFRRSDDISAVLSGSLKAV